jgi:hypothetical protein
LSEFNDGNAPGYTFESNNLTAATNIKSESTLNRNAQPFGDTTKYMVVQPENSNVPGFTPGAVIFNSPTLLSTFSIYWGSADEDNKVEFFNTNNSVNPFMAFTGADVFGSEAKGRWDSPLDNRCVPFTADSGFEFNKIRFSTGSIAFEFDAPTTRPVPVPAVVPGIALAAAFFGSKALKRNKKETGATIA